MTYTKNPNHFHDCYKLGEKIGEGAYSIVRNGTAIGATATANGGSNNANNTTYAIKCIDKGKVREKDLHTIYSEVSILQQLQHQHIIRLHDFFDEQQEQQQEAKKEERYFYLVMEKMTGGELFDRIVQKAFYNENEARNVCKIMLSALQFMHSKGIAHRDLKPENLLLVNQGNDYFIKIADFGFAKRCDENANNGMGDLKTALGTPSYVAPEILNSKPYNTKVDMWCVGVILYILLGGYPPFIENNEKKLFYMIRKCKYEFHDQYFNHVSDDAKNLISALIELDPKKRLSANHALENKWICSDDDTLVQMDLSGVNLSKLKKFNAKRKVRAAVYSLTAVNRLTSILSGK
jgi:calcium/calmodulin-dependent protein kinase I